MLYSVKINHWVTNQVHCKSNQAMTHSSPDCYGTTDAISRILRWPPSILQPIPSRTSARPIPEHYNVLSIYPQYFPFLFISFPPNMATPQPEHLHDLSRTSPRPIAAAACHLPEHRHALCLTTERPHPNITTTLPLQQHVLAQTIQRP